MIAIAESGSTKTQWFVIDLDGSNKYEFKTRGFNPDFHSAEFVHEALESSEEIQLIKSNIIEVYFFGASCSSENHIKKMIHGLSQTFNNAKVHVDHDLKACAYALSQGGSVISCIIGTGSNSALFDGEKVIEEVPALGFLLGDECSGSYFGKRLLSSYYYKKLPEEIANDFEKSYHLDWSDVREKVYGTNDGNVFLASFMPFVIKYKSHPYINKMLVEGAKAFIDIHVKCFDAYDCNEVGFVGTIASLISDILEKELLEAGYQLGKIIQSPGKDLVEYLIHEKEILLNHASNNQKVL